MNQRKNQKTLSTQWMTATAFMMAITLLLAMTPIGRIQLPFLTATTLHVPVIVATLVLGWQAGVLCGLTFGVHSCIVGLMNQGIIFKKAFGNPLVSVMPRVLFPLVVFVFAVWLDKALAKVPKKRVFQSLLSAAIGTACHTAVVMFMIYLLYGGEIASTLSSGGVLPEAITTNGVGLGIAVMGAVNGVPEMIVAAILVPPIVLALDRVLGKMRQSHR